MKKKLNEIIEYINEGKNFVFNIRRRNTFVIRPWSTINFKHVFKKILTLYQIPEPPLLLLQLVFPVLKTNFFSWFLPKTENELEKLSYLSKLSFSQIFLCHQLKLIFTLKFLKNFSLEEKF